MPAEQTQKEQTQQIGEPQDESRVPSGVPGLDELCEGGLERRSTVLVIGGAGSGKTTFLSQFVYSGAAFYDEPSIFLSLEESRESIMGHCSKFGWDLKSLEKEGKLAVINYKPHEVKKLAEEGGGLIWDTITEIGAKRIAIDSLSSYVVFFGSLYQAREAQLNLFDMVKKWRCTTLFSAESIKNAGVKTEFGMEHLSDAVIALHHPRKGSLRMRALEIFKMRGTNHSSKVCPFDIISNEGLVVYPGEDVFGEV
ncbi:MAG: ATPase domain-containing protein [Candidatus Micrarchaeia archaeon]